MSTFSPKSSSDWWKLWELHPLAIESLANSAEISPVRLGCGKASLVPAGMEENERAPEWWAHAREGGWLVQPSCLAWAK